MTIKYQMNNSSAVVWFAVIENTLNTINVRRFICLQGYPCCSI